MATFTDKPETISEASLKDAVRDIAEQILTKTDFHAYYYAPDNRNKKESYIYVSNGTDFLIVEKSDTVPYDYGVTFPIKGSREYGSGIRLPLIDEHTIESVEEIVDIVNEYMGPELSPGRYLGNFYEGKTFKNHDGSWKPLTQLVLK